jgi:DNA segregation ATPase FtsK/SpoIIIE, S-DNA-T family
METSKLPQPLLIDRPPRIQPELPFGEHIIPSPPELEEGLNQPLIQMALPLITIMGYVLVAVLGTRGTMLLIIPMGLAVIASVAVAIFSYVKEKKFIAEKRAAYSQRLVELRREMENYLEMQRIFYHYNYPGPQTTYEVVNDTVREGGERLEDIRSGSRIWERRTSDADFGRLYLGIGTIPSTVVYKLAEAEKYDNPQIREALRLEKDSQFVKDVPVTIPLKPFGAKQGEEAAAVRHALGVTGNDQGTVYEYLHSTLFDFLTFQSPNDSRIYVIGSYQARQNWRWLFNVPHCKENDQTETLVFEEEEDCASTQEVDRVRFFLKNLRTIVEARKIRMADKDHSVDVTLPFLVVIVDVLAAVPEWSALKDLDMEPVLSSILQDGSALGAAVIFLVPDRSKVPSGCQAILEIDPDQDHTKKAIFRYAETGINTQRYIGRNDLLRDNEKPWDFSKKLAPLMIRSSYGVDLQTTITLLDMLNVSSLDELRVFAQQNWQRSKEPANADWLETSVGLLSGNEIRKLVFSAKADGVHGLIAGSTGSGKSELLMTLVLGLALNYDPSIVNFVLVDYKGGAAFEPFRKLPHCVDIVTNLEGSATARMFASINAELDRRQKLNTFTDSKDIVHYRKKGLSRKEDAPPYPHLFIIIDEFSEMIAGNSEFKAQLESITRLGRSLGVTLILAAQRPAGVTDQMRANIKFRICLRVETPEDSRELLRRSDAAYLPSGIPGRGYLQVGNENIELIQTAYTGKDYQGSQKTSRPNVIWLDRPKLAQLTPTEEPPKIHDVMIDLLNNLAHEESRPQWRPWPAFLPRLLSLETRLDLDYMNENDIAVIGGARLPALSLEGETISAIVDVASLATIETRTDPKKHSLNQAVTAWLMGDGKWNGVDWSRNALRPIVGLIDNPYEARQMPLTIHFPVGHAVIFGASGWGKTTFLRTMLVSLAATHSPDELQIYILDCGGRNLNIFHTLPHVGAVILSDEEERIQRLLRTLNDILEERQVRLSDAGFNNIYEYNQAHPEKIFPAILFVVDNFAEFKENYDDLMAPLTSIIRDCRAFGIHFIATADVPTALPGKTYNLITERMTLRLSDSSEYTDIVGRGVPDMGEIPGRGFLRVGRMPLEFQTAMSFKVSEEDKLQRQDETAKLSLFIENMNTAWASGWKGKPPIPVLTLATHVSLEKIIQNLAEEKPGQVLPVIGIDDRNLLPYRLDLTRLGPHFVILGPPNSGKSTALRTLTLSLCESYEPQMVKIVLIDFQRRFFDYGGERTLADLPHVMQTFFQPTDLGDLAENLKMELKQPEYRQKKKQLFLLIDDYDSFWEEGERSNRACFDEIAGLAREFGTSGFHIVICGSTSITRSSDEIKKQAFASSFGLGLLTSEAASTLNGKVPRHLANAELPLGRGFLVKSGRTSMIQVATPYLNDSEVEKSLDAYIERLCSKYPGQKARWKKVDNKGQEKTGETSEDEIKEMKELLLEKGFSEEMILSMNIASMRETLNDYQQSSDGDKK